ncbi:uncharacterized protein LOC132048763 [Lycium ferocissimum]|uniref:uncharacterized protein LOC132048763 n=1 Tax=Lycium ferocissimum TaxID=112874 RepID=UPI002814F479|nr:uncharacterized protein LOC132048763 [Lycium ferocissimum]
MTFFLYSLLIFVAIINGIHAVNYSVTITTASGARFDRDIGGQYTLQTLDSATNFICHNILSINCSTDRKDVQHVSIFLDDDMDGDDVAIASNNEIHVNSRYTEGDVAFMYAYNMICSEKIEYLKTPLNLLSFNQIPLNYWSKIPPVLGFLYIEGYSGDVKKEITGVLYHEMTHIWQWKGNGQAPQGLIEGIADYVRLKVGLAPSHWVKPGQGNSWDQGYDVTARFLDYCNVLKYGFVGELNKKMRDCYSDTFFVDLLGKSVDQLWNDYKATFMY